MWDEDDYPNEFQLNEGINLGLSRKQVSTANFGYHTVNAIITEMMNGLSLEDAFAKFHGLTSIALDSMKQLGLNHEQVSTPNFGYHTMSAIKDIQKRSGKISSSEAFEMVKGKLYRDTQEYIKLYLETTKRPAKPINEMALIRVIVNTGRGFGHQRAAITLMQKLREIGFTGIFDIQCDDRLGARLMNTETQKLYINFEPLVSRKLISMIPGLESVQSDLYGVKVVKGLGALKISSLPHDHWIEDPRLAEVDLAV